MTLKRLKTTSWPEFKVVMPGYSRPRNWVRSLSYQINCKFSHLISSPGGTTYNLATRWCHLHWIQIWPPFGSTCAGLPSWYGSFVLSWYLLSSSISTSSLCDGQKYEPIDWTQGIPGSIKKVTPPTHRNYKTLSTINILDIWLNF